jgi:prophage tail gpP-like protein
MILPNFPIAEETVEEHVSRGERTLTLLGRLMGRSLIDCFSLNEDCCTEAQEC